MQTIGNTSRCSAVRADGGLGDARIERRLSITVATAATQWRKGGQIGTSVA